MRNLLRMSAAALSLLLLLLSLAGGTVAADQSYTINGVTVRYRDFSSSHNDCWAYTYNFYYKIWGLSMNSSFSGSDNSLRDRSNEELTLTPEHLKEYVSNAIPGAVLRICNSGYLHGNDGMGHSLLIVSIQEDGFTTFEGGLSASPHCREHFYTWEDFCKISWLGGRYGYIKYIKWPGASGEEPAAEPVKKPVEKPVEKPAEEPSRGTMEVPEQQTLPEPSDAQTYRIGDLDCTGMVDVTDYILLKRSANGMLRLTASQKLRADINGDGVIDLQDAALLKKHIYRQNQSRVLVNALPTVEIF